MILTTAPTPTAPAPAATPATSAVPPRPPVPAELLALAEQPLFRGEYRAVERDTWRDGLPLVGRKVSSQREVAFSNEFNVLSTHRGPMIDYAAATYEDALRAARDVAYAWSDPAFGGQIYSSVGVGVLQAADGAWFTALVGSGDPQTSADALGYRSDRFDNNVHGSFRRSTDSRATSAWTAPVDGDGRPVGVPAPSDDRPINRRDVEGVTIERLVSDAPQLKAIVDVRSVLPVGV